MPITLPSADNLGNAPVASATRPVVGLSGAGAIGQAVSNIGDATERVGLDMISADRRAKAAAGKVSTAYAQADYLTKDTEFRNTLDGDPNTSTYGSRYLENSKKWIADSSQMIPDPAERAEYVAAMQVKQADGLSNILSAAKKQEGVTGQTRMFEVLDRSRQDFLAAKDEQARAAIIQNVNGVVKASLDKGWVTPEFASSTTRKWGQEATKDYVAGLPFAEQQKILAPMIAYKSGSDTSGAQPAGGGSGFDSSMAIVAKNEGGYTALDGSSGAPAIYGINARAHPQAFARVKQITDEKGEEAGHQAANEFFKAEYWDKNHIGDLPRATQTIVLDGVVNHWAGFQDRLVKAARNGASPDDLLDMRRQEYDRLHAANPKKYPSSQVDQWNRRLETLRTEAVGNSSGDDASGPGGMPKFGNMLDFMDRGDLETLYNKNQVVMRSQLEQRGKDDVAAAKAGQPTEPISESDFIAAYGAEGAQKHSEYLRDRGYGQAYNGVATMTQAEQQATLDAWKPQPGAGFADDEQHYGQVQQAISAANEARMKDPVGFAQTHGLASPQPLDFSEPELLRGQLAERGNLVTSMNEKFGTPIMPFNSSEAKAFSASLNDSTPKGKMATLRMMRGAFSDNATFLGALQQVRPDSPATAIAGQSLSRSGKIDTGTEQVSGDTVAERILIGESLLNPTKIDQAENGKGKTFLMPADAKLDKAFSDYVGDAFAGQPKAEADARQAFRAYYAGTSSLNRKTDPTELDDDTANASLAAVIGGISEHADKSVIMPWGMDETAFRDQVKLRYDTLAKENGFGRNRDFDDMPLVSTGDPGVYMLQSGAGVLFGKDQKPVIIDMNAPLPVVPKDAKSITRDRLIYG